MNTIMLFAALGLVVGIIIASCCKRETGKSVCSNLVGVSVGTAGGAIVGLLIALLVIAYMVPMRDVVYGPAKLVVMRGSDGISGTLIWSFGSSRYNFLLSTDTGRLVPSSVPAEGLVNRIEDPALNDTGSWKAIMREADQTSPLYPWALGTNYRTEIVSQEFRVPVGTVVRKFHID